MDQHIRWPDGPYVTGSPSPPVDIFGKPRTVLEQAIYDVAVQAINERLRPPPYFLAGTTMDDNQLLVSRALLQLQVQRLEQRIAELETRKPWWRRLWKGVK